MLEIIDNGKNNQITVDTNSDLHINSKLHITGDGNIIHISPSSKLINQTIFIKKNNNKLFISDNSKMSGFLEFIGSNNELFIGKNTEIGNAKFFIAEQKKVYIGDECLLSWGIIFRTSDMHSIFDEKTKKRINYGKDIIIGNKVWMSSEVLLLKGAQVLDNSIIGTRSVVSNVFDVSGVIIAGVPAKIIKKNICWDKRFLDEYPIEAVI